MAYDGMFEWLQMVLNGMFEWLRMVYVWSWGIQITRTGEYGLKHPRIGS